MSEVRSMATADSERMARVLAQYETLNSEIARTDADDEDSHRDFVEVPCRLAPAIRRRPAARNSA